MISKILLTCTIISVSLFGQSQSIVYFLTSPDYSNYFPKGAKSVTETTYNISYDDTVEPDTVLTFNGNKYNLKYSNIIHKNKIDTGKFRTTTYGPDKAIMSKGYKLFKDGKLVEDVDEYEEDNLKSMSYHKYLTYQNDKLVKIIDKPCPDCDVKSEVSLSYDREKLPKEVFFSNAQIGEMRIVRSKKDEEYRYDYSMVIGEEMKALFEQMGKSIENEIMPYDEVSLEEDGTSFIVIHYKADRENGAHHLDTKTCVTFDGKILKEEEYSEGEVVTAMSYTYDAKGMLISQTDINGETYHTEFNNEGQYTKKREGYKWSQMDYDANGNLIKSALTGFNDNLVQVTIFSIEY